MNKYFLALVTMVIVSFTVFDYFATQEIIESKTKNQEIQMEEHSNPEYLYKIVSGEEWQESMLQNQVVNSSMDKDFIHLAKEDQVAHIVQKFWNDRDYIILKLASKKLMGRLIYETNPGGTTKYYHLYDGNIPLEAVKDVTTIY